MKAIIVANWKMNPPNFVSAKRLFGATKNAAARARGVAVVVAPPAIFLRELRANYRSKKIAFAVQNAYVEEKGAFTGEISLVQAHDAGASYVIVGHAERRAMGETSDDTRYKVATALSLKMTPILCVGEKERGRDGGYFDVIKEQLRIGLADVPENKIAKVIIAYEPVWAIGASEAMSPQEMHTMAVFIRKTIVEMRGKGGMSLKILYGGAIDESNAVAMLKEGDVDGLLIGRASAEAKKSTALIQTIAKAYV